MSESAQPEPTAEEFDELIGYLPRLSAPGFVAIQASRGGVYAAKGVMTLPWPEYSEVARRLFGAFSGPAWQDYGYLSRDPEARMTQPGFIENATLDEIKCLMTFCVRGERFCDGHWGGMIEAGYVERILRRLDVIRPDAHRA